ncbi:MAG: glycosyltransferase [Elusimicrobiota bacterium]|jgi:glycosyltransferase involved in cell wall biosynthesis|nr:glycosyltransferase [Elusimicrobiota bacterium]
MPKISVIVPVYNTRKYLCQCLDSIVRQTLHDIEIIIINDGSTDDSLEIIKKYAQKDRRIVVIDKQNKGVGETYNRGIATASSQYIGFVESDDWIEADMYEHLYNIVVQNPDVQIVKGQFVPFDHKTKKNGRLSNIPETEINKVVNPLDVPSVFYVEGGIWTAIYDADFIRKNNIRFLETPGASYQDISFNFKTFAVAQRIILTAKLLLHYRTGHSTQSIKSTEKVFSVCDEFAEINCWLHKYKPELAKSIEPVCNSIKNSIYNWNLNRLGGEKRAAFLKRYRTEFADILARNAIDMTATNSKNKAKLDMLINPTIWNKVKYIVIGKIARLFLKDRIRNGYTRYSVFFGLIPIWKKCVKLNAITNSKIEV